MEKVKYCIDELKIVGVANPTLYFRGWVLSDDYIIKIYSNDDILTLLHGQQRRVDVSTAFNTDNDDNRYGFYRSIKLKNKNKHLKFVLENNGEKIEIASINNYIFLRIMTKIKIQTRSFLSIIKTFLKSLLHYILRYIKMPRAIFNKKLRSAFIKELKFNINTKNYDINNDTEYRKWIKEYETFTPVKKLSYNPLISFVIPCYNPEEKYLKECIDSLLHQTYQNFEICIADDCSPKEYVKKVLKEYEKLDKRIKVFYREKNGNISAATNSAIEIAKGEFIALVDNDDILMPNALYEVVYALNQNNKIDLIYSDEDKLDLKGRRCLPHFKGDWSPDTLLSMNYITHFAVLRTRIVNKIGGFRTKCDGAQDYDMFLRFTEQTTGDKIYHISKILYNWRMSETSTAFNTDSKGYAAEAGRVALQDALDRRKIKGKARIYDFTTYTVDYEVDKKIKVSIIIPTRDKIDILNQCLESIYKYTNHNLFNIIIVNNNSQEKESLIYLKNIVKNYSNIKVINNNDDFNYSRINNNAAKIAKDDLLLFLNNDVKVIQKKWLETMMGYALQDHVGAVGVKLLYPDDTIQHAGVVLGLGYFEIASHPFIREKNDFGGFFSRITVL